MRVGILGSGLMGGKLGTIFAQAGHEVVFSYARSMEKLKRLARDAQGNARAGTPRDPYGLPVTPSRLHCLLASLHTEEKMGLNWRIGSIDSGNRMTKIRELNNKKGDTHGKQQRTKSD